MLTDEINARIEENKSLLDMAILHMDERAVLVIKQRIFILEKMIDDMGASYNMETEATEIESLSSESHTHGRTAEDILAEIIFEDERKMLLENARKTVSHNGITYDMIREELVLQAMHDFRTQPDYIQNRQEGVTKFLTVAEMRDFEQKVSNGEWSYSFMVEHLCKMADSFRNQPQQVREEVSAEDIGKAIKWAGENYFVDAIGNWVDALNNIIPIEKITTEYLQSHPVNTGDGWLKVEDGLPLTYKKGYWDGTMSDFVLTIDNNGNYKIGCVCRGTLDGVIFSEWYDETNLEMGTPIKWQPSPPVQ